jgi:hypothetical protein
MTADLLTTYTELNRTAFVFLPDERCVAIQSESPHLNPLPKGEEVNGIPLSLWERVRVRATATFPLYGNRWVKRPD